MRRTRSERSGELPLNIFKKCLRNEWRRLLFLALKIVLGGTTARRNIRCGGLYLFCVE
jgi:hypothetical protein